MLWADRATRTDKTAQVRNYIKLTWSWLLWHAAWFVFTSQDDPRTARLLPLQLPPMPATHIKLPGRGELLHHQKELQECAQPTFCSTCFYLLSSQLRIWRQQKKISSAGHVHTQGEPGRSSVWSPIKPNQRQFSLERGPGNCSRSWKLTQFKHVTLLWSFTLYTQINLHHDFPFWHKSPLWFSISLSPPVWILSISCKWQ